MHMQMLTKTLLLTRCTEVVKRHMVQDSGGDTKRSYGQLKDMHPLVNVKAEVMLKPIHSFLQLLMMTKDLQIGKMKSQPMCIMTANDPMCFVALLGQNIPNWVGKMACRAADPDMPQDLKQIHLLAASKNAG